MAKIKHVLRTAMASGIALALAVMPSAALAQDAASEGVEALVESASEIAEEASQTLQTAREGYINVTVEDPMRAAISELAGNTDDMSWVKNAELLMQEVPNESGGADAEVTLLFNDTELYHLQLSYDAQAQVLYALCPELLDQAMALPFQAVQDTGTQIMDQIPPEILEEIGALLVELGEFFEDIPAQTLQQSAMKYLGTLSSYITVEQGIATATAGTLYTEINTVSYKVSAEDMRVMVPQLLQLLSEDQVLEQTLKSDFVSHVLRIAMQQAGVGVQISGDDLYTLISSFLAQKAQADYSDLYGFRLTVGTTNDGKPASISLAIETGEVTADLLSIDMITDDTNYAAELKIGPALASEIGLDASGASGIVAQGYLEQNLLYQTVSVNVNGENIPVYDVSGLNLEQLEEGKLVGIITAYTDNRTYTHDFDVAEDGTRKMDLYINEDLWCTVTGDLYEADELELDEFDTSDAITVSDEESLAAYMRGAKVTRMLEKLADAGVPQGYVDKLTSSEASTESSRENTVELDAAS